MTRKETFLQHQGQTSPFPFLIDVDYARGLYFYDKSGKRYMDMISGVAVNNIGHNHPKVIKAIHEQVDRHLHVMVYGEFIQDAQLNLTNALISKLPKTLDGVYPVNSGTEANEAAIKLARRVTGRSRIVSCLGSYHGSTLGSMSISANEVKKSPFRPLVPDVYFIKHNDISSLDLITPDTAGVIIETIQGDAGVRVPDLAFIQEIRKRCDEVGALLIFDEIQCGMGRSGKLFAFEHFNVVPDAITLGKALGGGMSIGALVSSQKYLNEFRYDPMLGHITTFGGHPVNCAAAAAFLDVMETEIDFTEIERLGKLLEELIADDPEIIASRRIGMMFAFDMSSSERVERVVTRALEKGVLTFWFLSHPYSFRLSPPLNITEEQVREAAKLILESIEETR